MKCLVVDVAFQDKDNVTTCWVSFSKLARWKDDKQKLYHSKKSELIKMMAVTKQANPGLFDKVSVLLPGSLVEVEQVVNEYDKPVIKDVIVIKKSPYNFDECYK